MWHYPLVNCFFLVCLHYTYCCYCNQQHGLVNAKGETGTGYKRQLDLEEYNKPDFDIENSSKKDSNINSLFHESFTVDNITIIQIENLTTPSALPTEDTNITTAPVKNVTETSAPEESSSSPVTSTPSVYTTTTASETNTSTEISVLNGTSAAINETSAVNRTSETTNISVSETTLQTNVTEFIQHDSLYSELNLGIDQGVSMYCDKYKRTVPLNINKMADIWRIAYYTMPQRLKCFKLHIKLLSTEDQQYYSKIYGNFNNRINWAKCDLEIMSRDSNNKSTNRRHFLQSIDSVSGVMKNIIIEEDISAKVSSVALVEETPDQWLVVKNLLLMRDCINGELVAFTRVPMEPKMIDIEDALSQFGEDRVINGTRAC